MGRAYVKGNLAHKFMDLYFLCLSFHLDVYIMMKAKKIATEDRKFNLEIVSKLDFPTSPCVTSLL